MRGGLESIRIHHMRLTGMPPSLLHAPSADLVFLPRVPRILTAAATAYSTVHYSTEHPVSVDQTHSRSVVRPLS